MPDPMKPAELLPCPFCGGTDVTIEPCIGDTDHHYVYCNGCELDSPPQENYDKTVEFWNRRAALAPYRAVVAELLGKWEARLADLKEAFSRESYESNQAAPLRTCIAELRDAVAALEGKG